MSDRDLPTEEPPVIPPEDQPTPRPKRSASELNDLVAEKLERTRLVVAKRFVAGTTQASTGPDAWTRQDACPDASVARIALNAMAAKRQ